ncbi:MAG: cytochrome c oxidase assembly factor Coa1 family protein, partial [Blastocatellia bacterium]
QPVVMPAGMPVKRRSVIKIILVIAVIGILIFVGAIVAIFFGARSLLKNSEANREAVQALRESPSVSRALGDIRDIGTPMGNISTASGGSGSADLSMSVEGSRGSGRYYTTLARRNGKWVVLSGRVDLRDGRSVSLEGRSRGPGNF